MIKAEIKFDEEKLAKTGEYSISQLINATVQAFKKIGGFGDENIVVHSDNTITCEKKDSFAEFGVVTVELSHIKWFAKYVERWFLYFPDETDDVLECYLKRPNETFAEVRC